MPVVASIPRRSERLVRRKAGGGVWADPVEAEAYGRLATNLRFFNFDRQVKTVLVTSAIPEEGKTTVTLRLAAALAGAGQGVLADRGRPPPADVHRLLQHPVPARAERRADRSHAVRGRRHAGPHELRARGADRGGRRGVDDGAVHRGRPGRRDPAEPDRAAGGQRAAAGAPRCEGARRHRARRLCSARPGRRRDPDRERGRRRAARGEAGREPARRAAPRAQAARDAALEGDRRRDHERRAARRTSTTTTRPSRPLRHRPWTRSVPAGAAAARRRGSRTTPRRTAPPPRPRRFGPRRR